MKCDIFIKDEGFAHVKPQTNEAKTWCKKIGFENSLEEFGDTFAGQPVWDGKNNGMFMFAIKRSAVKRFKKFAETNGFVVESEI